MRFSEPRWKRSLPIMTFNQFVSFVGSSGAFAGAAAAGFGVSGLALGFGAGFCATLGFGFGLS